MNKYTRHSLHLQSIWCSIHDLSDNCHDIHFGHSSGSKVISCVAHSPSHPLCDVYMYET